MHLNPWGALEMEEKLRISSVSKLTVMISFICESIKHLTHDTTNDTASFSAASLKVHKLGFLPLD